MASDAGMFGDATTSDTSFEEAEAPLADADAGDENFPDAGTVALSRTGGTPIAATAFGQNYWDWEDWSNDGNTGLTGTEAPVTALHLDLIRAGGNNNDSNDPALFDAAHIDAFVNYCRRVGAEPILQVPLIVDGFDGGAASAEGAANMVTYANGTKGYQIKYWEIGNEPDMYAVNLDAGFAAATPAGYCAQYSRYVSAMRAANAAASDGGGDLVFLGPELAYKYVPGNDWLTPFLDACKNDVDVVTIHRYPFSALQTKSTAVLGDLSAFRSTVASVRAIVQAHARPGTPLGITEANVSYDYDGTKYTALTLGAAPGSFYAGLWTADEMGAALESGLWTLAFWNIGEVSPQASVLGFLFGGKPSPAYYGEKLVSSNFRGVALAAPATPPGISVHASYDEASGTTSVLVLNRSAAPSQVTLAVDTLAPAPVNLPATSMALVVLPDAPGASVRTLHYTADMADAGMPPQ